MGTVFLTDFTQGERKNIFVIELNDVFSEKLLIFVIELNDVFSEKLLIQWTVWAQCFSSGAQFYEQALIYMLGKNLMYCSVYIFVNKCFFYRICRYIMCSSYTKYNKGCFICTKK